MIIYVIIVSVYLNKILTYYLDIHSENISSNNKGTDCQLAPLGALLTSQSLAGRIESTLLSSSCIREGLDCVLFETT